MSQRRASKMQSKSPKQTHSLHPTSREQLFSSPKADVEVETGCRLNFADGMIRIPVGHASCRDDRVAQSGPTLKAVKGGNGSVPLQQKKTQRRIRSRDWIKHIGRGLQDQIRHGGLQSGVFSSIDPDTEIAEYELSLEIMQQIPQSRPTLKATFLRRHPKRRQK